jgi:hypothetical protein
MPSICIPDTSGHVEFKWDSEKPEEVEHARRHFDELKRKGHIFFRINPKGKKGEPSRQFEGEAGGYICEFDPKADVVATQVPVGG